MAVVHFVHRPKPWETSLSDAASEMSKLTLKLNIEPLVRGAPFHSPFHSAFHSLLLTAPFTAPSTPPSTAERAVLSSACMQVHAWRFHCAGSPRGNGTLTPQDDALFRSVVK